MNANIVRLFFLFAMIGILFMATGCKTTGNYVRWYDGPPAETNKVALLKVQRDIWTVTLTVDKIDGQSLTTNKFVANVTSKIELMPGQHELWVSYRDADDKRSTADMQISFLAEMGKTYELRGAPLESSFGKAFTRALFFQHWYWTLWIVDAETRAN
ncbi:MAG TPA: hypothetical protein VIK59_12225 [Verrucomicrobiae bacterium]